MSISRFHATLSFYRHVLHHFLKQCTSIQRTEQFAKNNRIQIESEQTCTQQQLVGRSVH